MEFLISSDNSLKSDVIFRASKWKPGNPKSYGVFVRDYGRIWDWIYLAPQFHALRQFYVPGLLDDMQETTLFARNGKKEMISGNPEQEDSGPVQRNGDAIANKRFPANGSSHPSASSNGRLNTAYKDELSSDEDNTWKPPLNK